MTTDSLDEESSPVFEARLMEVRKILPSEGIEGILGRLEQDGVDLKNVQDQINFYLGDDQKKESVLEFLDRLIRVNGKMLLEIESGTLDNFIGSIGGKKNHMTYNISRRLEIYESARKAWVKGDPKPARQYLSGNQSDLSFLICRNFTAFEDKGLDPHTEEGKKMAKICVSNAFQWVQDDILLKEVEAKEKSAE